MVIIPLPLHWAVSHQLVIDYFPFFVCFLQEHSLCSFNPYTFLSNIAEAIEVQLADNAKCNYSVILVIGEFFQYFTNTSEVNVDIHNEFVLFPLSLCLYIVLYKRIHYILATVIL